MCIRDRVGLAILLIGMMLAVGAGATFRYYEADRSITVAIVADDNEFIDLTPTQPYAYLNNGKLTVEISKNNPNYNQTLGFGTGLSPNTTYVFEHMFNVSNELWENNDTDRYPNGFPICVQISISQNSGVEIFEGDWDGTSSTQLQFCLLYTSPSPRDS